jgi:hypothetical protein
MHDASKTAGGIAVANTGGRCRAYISSTHMEILVPDWLLLMAGQGLQHGHLNALDGPKRILLGYWLCVIDELKDFTSLLGAFASLSDGPTSLASIIASSSDHSCRCPCRNNAA